MQRQRQNLELIASENYASVAVMAAMGSHLTNKYAEGYPGRRYYGGCVNVDTVEDLARTRAKQLFGAEHANVQPHSGAQANMAVYFTVLKPGDTVLGLDLAHGGHLTHGHPLNSSGILYKFIGYHVARETERVDMDEVRRLAREHKPKLIVVGASAYPRTFDFPAFRAIADEVGALVMVDMAHIAGLVATGHHPSPVPHADFVTTTTHKTLRGPRGGLVLCREKYAKDLDRALFPGIQGGPLMHVIAAKAVALGEALQARVQGLPGAGGAQRRRPGPGPGGQGLAHRLGRHRQPPDAGGRVPAGHPGQRGRAGPGQGRHHRQQERHPLRPQPPAQALGHPGGLPGRHHPRA